MVGAAAGAAAAGPVGAAVGSKSGAALVAAGAAAGALAGERAARYSSPAVQAELQLRALHALPLPADEDAIPLRCGANEAPGMSAFAR
jgi:hypothetical protein